MRDVAAAAGVSFKTVSRVVNDETGVRPELVARVQAAIAELGYRPNQGARRLRQHDSEPSTIGFVLVDVANQFFGTLLRGIEEVATDRNCLVLSGSTDRSPEREQQLIEAFLARRVDGLIIVYSGSSPALLRAEMDRGTPVVFLDLEPEAVEADLVRSDHYQGAVDATTHLINHGHTDIAFFGDDATIFSATLRQKGFRDALEKAGLSVREQRIITGSHTEDEWRTIAVDYFSGEAPPTAVFSAQNIITVGVVSALHALQLQHTIAQVGFDDLDLANTVQPGITVVPQNPLDLGRRAAEAVFARIDGSDDEPSKQILSSPLISRGSGEIPPSH